MKSKTTTELIVALQQMLSKDSNRFSTEEIRSLKEAIAGLKNLQLLEESKKDEPGSKEIKRAIMGELVQVAGSLMRFLLTPEALKHLRDLLDF